METLKQQVIDWLRKNTTREQWFDIRTMFFTEEQFPNQTEATRNCRTFPREAGEHDAKVYVRVTDNEFNTDTIHFEDVFCEIDQPTFIADAIYDLTGPFIVGKGRARYNLTLNRFEDLEREWNVGASDVGPNKAYTAFLVTKEGFIAKHTDEVPPNGMDSTSDPDSAAEWYVDGKKVKRVGGQKPEGTLDFTMDDENREKLHDLVHNVKHYEVFREIEAYQVIETVLNSDICKHLTPYEAYCFGNVLKYRLRVGAKDDPQQEIDKAVRYKACLKDREG